jgi:hypothetical protein
VGPRSTNCCTTRAAALLLDDAALVTHEGVVPVFSAISGHFQSQSTSRFRAIGDRLASLRDEEDRQEVIYAKNLPRNSPASCLRGIADDLRQRMRQNKKRPLPGAGPIAVEPAD